jgi:hypothetical protein
MRPILQPIDGKGDGNGFRLGARHFRSQKIGDGPEIAN